MNRRRRRRKKQQIPAVLYQMSKKEIAGWGVLFCFLFILAPYAFYTNFHIFVERPAGITALALMFICTIWSYCSLVKKEDLAEMTIIETAVAIAEHFWVMVLIIAALIIIDAAISTSYSIWTGLLLALPGSIFLSAGLSSPAIFLTTILLRCKAN